MFDVRDTEMAHNVEWVWYGQNNVRFFQHNFLEDNLIKIWLDQWQSYDY